MSLTRRSLILAKLESNYGTDPAPTGTANAILAYDIDLTQNGEVLERSVLRDTLSHLPHVIGLQDQMVNFKIELKGDTTPIGTQPNPNWHPLLMSCGFATVVTGTQISFVPVSQESSMLSCTIYVFQDGNLHKYFGCRGNAKFNMEAGKFPFIEFEMSGLFNTTVTSTTPTSSNAGDNVNPPICVGSAFTIGAYTPITKSVVIDLRNTVTRRDALTAVDGVYAFRISDRKPQITWDTDAVTEATNPFWTNWDTSTGKSFNIRFGASAATGRNMIGISCPLFMAETIKYGDDNGILTYDITGVAAASAPAGDDEFKLHIC